MWKLFSQWQELSGDTQYAGVHWTKVVRALAYPTTQAQPMLQVAMRELWHILQYIVINKIIAYKQLILVFLLHFSVALAQNTSGITTVTTMATAGRYGPLAPHTGPCAPRQRFKWMGDNPQSLHM